jgi:hypothetical protein
VDEERGEGVGEEGEAVKRGAWSVKRAPTMKCALMAFLGLCCAIEVAASPAADLKSPSPAVRAAAAAKLRASYTPPARAKWDAVLAQLKIGDARTNVEAILKANAIKSGYGRGGAGFSHIEHRLDEAWLLKCVYRGSPIQRDETLDACSIELQYTYVNVAMPTNFTGTWIMYYVNGQKCIENNMKDGVPCGDCIDYVDDGKTWIVHHYEPGSPGIGYTQYYYRSDKIMTRGTKDRSGTRIGMWTNYSQVDGSVMGIYPEYPQRPPH